MTHARLVELGEDLSSRERARLLREDFLAHAGNNAAALVFDFAGVRTLSDSFADELIAVLVERQGQQWFKERVKIINITREQRTIILSVVQARLQRASRQATSAA